METSIVYKKEAYLIIGKCMEVHNELGHGFLESVYKSALEIAFTMDGIQYQREKPYSVYYKDFLLPQKFYADFVVMDNIILEVKCVSKLGNEHIAQTLNYLKVSGNKLALLVNFGKDRLEYQRLIL
ncbi:MAG: GxxExxY protein [Cryomorphaceae bacterium]|nr:GxxExxY protein [Cryomorphaceae bacterium]